MTSMGGPLIVVPESACHLWGGAPRNYPDDEGDYGRACAVEDLIGLIDVGPPKALVLGDDPAAATFLPGHGVIVREIAGDPDVDYEPIVARLLPDVTWDPELSWDVREPVILFDSVHASSEIASGEHLRIELSPGRYSVGAAYTEIPGEASLILIRLTLDAGAI
ncbi:Imm21 family immunity protein [Streptomyces sp. RPT161]|uniref:Imm21 family immunity protein n=1 Tax=Streptomyces sp. RPT161 TaxID=3015993 RepID=UPI0022B85C28|nr:Imm21 family immunity protein [Streptomyces sp. RPT161]